jgi:hypothetical protein
VRSIKGAPGTTNRPRRQERAAGTIRIKSPFTDISPHGPDALFDTDAVDRLVAAVNDIRHRGQAA